MASLSSKLALETLPVELIAEILGQLDLQTLIYASHTSKRLRTVSSDPQLNPWRLPIARSLSQSNQREPCLATLCILSAVPRRNWIEVLVLAKPEFILFEAEVPHLTDAEWGEAFRCRFLPSWRKWKRNGPWKGAFMKTLWRVWHRSNVRCTSDEAWTKYMVLNRNGSANELEGSSRHFDPLARFEFLKMENNLAGFTTRIRVVIQLADVRILAFGVQHTSHSWLVNPNAGRCLNPAASELHYQTRGPQITSRDNAFSTHLLSYPRPHQTFELYPSFTPGGMDQRLIDEEAIWVGPMMLTAQIANARTADFTVDTDLVEGPGHGSYASFTWEDLCTIAPWMRSHVTQSIEGPGLGV